MAGIPHVRRPPMSVAPRAVITMAEHASCVASPDVAPFVITDGMVAPTILAHGTAEVQQRYLASLRVECGGRVCIGVLPVGVFEATGTTAEDTEGLVDYARAVDNVDIGVLIEWATNGEDVTADLARAITDLDTEVDAAEARKMLGDCHE